MIYTDEIFNEAIAVCRDLVSSWDCGYELEPPTLPEVVDEARKVIAKLEEMQEEREHAEDLRALEKAAMEFKKWRTGQ